MKLQHRSIIFSLILLIGLLFGTSCTPKTPPAPATTPTEALDLTDEGLPLAPKVVGQSPSLGEESPLDANIEIYFDQAMDITQTTAAWAMDDAEGNPVEGEITWPDEQTLHFQPETILLPEASYQITLGTVAASAEGVPLTSEFTFYINTISKLQISQVFPTNGSFDVETDSIITTMFNRPVVPLVVGEDQASLPQPLNISPSISGQGEWLSTSVYIFRPDESLIGGTVYTAVVEAGLSDATNMEETRLAQDYSWQFTTAAPYIESLSIPDVVSSPKDDYVDVPLNATFAIRFHQPMERTSTENAFALITLDNNTVGGSFEWDETSTEMIFEPDGLLDLGMGYALTLRRTAQAVEGGSLRTALLWNFTTVFPPAIVRVTPYNGQVQSQFSAELIIEFASPMDRSTLENKVIISPRPEDEIRWQYYGRKMYFYGLEPSTAYEVRILPGMTDPHGNRIRYGSTINFVTASLSPSAYLQMPGLFSLYRARGEHEFALKYVNVNAIQFELHRMSIEQFISLRNSNISLLEFNAFVFDLVRTWTEENTVELNKHTTKQISLTTSEDSPLPSGLYLLRMRSNEISRSSQWLDARLLIVATANLTLKTTPAEALVWLTDLESGQPVANVPITVYDEMFNNIGQGTSDSDGLAHLDLPLPAERYVQRYVIAQDNQNFAISENNWGSDVYPYDFGIRTHYTLQPGQPTVYLYTDRPLYRPGQNVYFKGIVRVNDDLDYGLPEEQEVEVTIESYKGKIYEDTLSLSEFGTFDGDVTLDEDATLGNYYIEVRFPESEDSIGGRSISVAEYRKPEFQVDLQTSQSEVLDGDTFDAIITAEFFSGGAVADAAVSWVLSSQPYTFFPSGEYSRFSFIDRDRDTAYWLRSPFDYGHIVAEGEARTDENGELLLKLPVDLSETDASQRYSLEATVIDLAGNAVSIRSDIIAHLSEFYVGIRPNRYVGRVGDEQSFNLVVLDWKSNPIPGEELEVAIVERRWHSVQEEDDAGRTIWTSSVEEIPIVTLTDVIVDDTGRASVSFIPPRAGVYRAKVMATDSRGTDIQSSAYLWVSGGDYVSWRQTNDHSFQLILDRQSYLPGDTAEIMIASPFQGETYALITVERGHVMRKDVVKLSSNSAVYKLPITADMAPNVYISVIVIKGVDETSPMPDYRMGMTEITIDTREQVLFVELAPDEANVGPGDEVTYNVRTTDIMGRPARAELSMALVDLAALTLTSPNAPPMVDYFYSQRSLSVFTAMPLTFSVDAFIAELDEQAKGGGGGGGDMGVMEVREEFPDTAFWEAHVVTDDNGEAIVNVTLPDSLTTWRMDTRAVTIDTLVGQTTVDIVSSKPLLVRPQTPRFFVAGDQLLLGTAVHNNTSRSLNVSVVLEAKGVTIEADATQEVIIMAGSQALVRWPVTVESTADRVDLIFRASGGGYTDASRPTLGTLEGQGIPVLRYEVPETIATAGHLTSGGSRTESISLPVFPDFEVKEGQLTINLAPSLAAGLTDGLTYLEHFPYECVEQTISRFLPNVIITRTLKEAGLSDPDLEANLEAQVNIALQRLYNQQHVDGGWGWWPNNDSNPLSTAYVVQGMVEAKESGYSVNEEVIDDAVEFLVNQLEYVGSLEATYRLNRQAYILYVLTRAGYLPVSDIVQLYEARQSLSLFARGYLAQALHAIDPHDPRLDTLVSDFVNHAALSATGTHWDETYWDYWNWNTNTRTTAIILDTLVKIDPENSLSVNVVRWLMLNRDSGRWRGTQETAWVLMALTRWIAATGELSPQYIYEAALNGQSLGGGTADVTTLRTSNELNVEVGVLLADEINRLTIARNNGPGTLYYTTYLTLSLPVEEVKALDRGITISRGYFHPDDRDTPITEIVQGEIFLGRLTIVAPHDLHYVFIEDPLPAGAELIDQSLKTSQQVSAPARYDWDDIYLQGWGWWYFDHVELHDEKVVLSSSYLPAGVYEYTYLVRASFPGTYRVIPPTSREFYFPEVYGRGDGSLFVVTP